MMEFLKIKPEYFLEVLSKKKTFEIRKNDRNFEVGDLIVLEEWTKESGYTNRFIETEITYITDFQQKENYVVFSFKFLSSGTNYMLGEELLDK